MSLHEALNPEIEKFDVRTVSTPGPKPRLVRHDEGYLYLQHLDDDKWVLLDEPDNVWWAPSRMGSSLRDTSITGSIKL